MLKAMFVIFKAGLNPIVFYTEVILLLSLVVLVLLGIIKKNKNVRKLIVLNLAILILIISGVSVNTKFVQSAMNNRISEELLDGLQSMRAFSIDKTTLGYARIGAEDFTLSDEPLISKQSEYTIDSMYKGDPSIGITAYYPQNYIGNTPAIIYIHGGGYIMGSTNMSDPTVDRMVTELNVPVFAVDYRLAPENPYPSGLHDCYSALNWIYDNADELNIDKDNIITYGESAGGGLVSALSLLARDENGPNIVLQIPLAPMLDDTVTTYSSQSIKDTRIWNKFSNEFGWKSYLGDLYGTENIPYTAAPARCTDYEGIPKTYTMIGTADLFLDETIQYVNDLRRDNVNVTFNIYRGGYHGFNQFDPDKEVSIQANDDLINYLSNFINDIYDAQKIVLVDKTKNNKVMEEYNKEVQIRIIEEAHNQQNVDMLDELFSKDLIDHHATEGQKPARDGYKEVLSSTINNIPDLNVTISDLVAEGNLVMYRGTVTGTIAGTNEKIEYMEIMCSKFENGKVSEIWGLRGKKN